MYFVLENCIRKNKNSKNQVLRYIHILRLNLDKVILFFMHQIIFLCFQYD